MRPFLTVKIVVTVLLTALGALWVYNLPIPLNGTHQWRQSDTLITAYYYCTEDARFAYPKVAARDGTSGVAIGEFPVFSYVAGLACRASGGWSEAAPKVLNLLFLLGAIFFWGAFLRRKWGPTEHHWLFWVIAFAMTPLHLNYLTIPMPEATALFFFGLAAWLWQIAIFNKKSSYDVLASLVFLLAFMIRPYHVWLLFVLAPSWKRSAQVLVLCVAGFGLWYRWWAGLATERPGYFGIGFGSPAQLLAAVPRMLMAIPERISDQTAWIGLVPLVIGARFAPLWGLGFLASWGSMMVLKPTHIPAHAYYLMNAGFFASVLIYLGWRRMKPLNFAIVASLFALISVASTQHNFRRDSQWPIVSALIDAGRAVPPGDQVVSYMGQNPKWLYYLKRTGSMREPSEWKGPGSCPEGMKYFLRERADQAPELGICGNVQ